MNRGVNFDSSRLKIGVFGRSGQWLMVSSVQSSTHENNCWAIVPLPTTMHTKNTFSYHHLFCISLPTWAHWVELPCCKSGAVAQGPTLSRLHTWLNAVMKSLMIVGFPFSLCTLPSDYIAGHSLNHVLFISITPGIVLKVQ